MIKYVKGDATTPIGDGIKLLCHICNDIGGWGSGFVLALSAKWKDPEREYRNLPIIMRKLGYVQYVPVDNDLIVVNMIAQNNTKPNEFGVPPVRYSAVNVCLKKVVNLAKSLENNSTPVSIHMPIIGCGLGGGSWEIMEATINDAVGDFLVIVYDIGNVLDPKYFKI